jgi:hypothetical protein
MCLTYVTAGRNTPPYYTAFQLNALNRNRTHRKVQGAVSRQVLSSTLINQSQLTMLCASKWPHINSHFVLFYEMSFLTNLFL